MKKLMMAAAIVCAAAGIQAAQVSWAVSSLKGPAAGTGTYSGSTLTGAKLSVYLVSETVFNNTSVDAIYKYVADNKLTADYTATSNMGGATAKSSDTYTTGNKVYALELITYTDSSKNEWYVANKSWVEIAAIEGTAQNASVSGLNSTIGGGNDAKSFTGSGTSITGWTAAPEPTSGLLLLIGMGALALRRRRA